MVRVTFASSVGSLGLDLLSPDGCSPLSLDLARFAIVEANGLGRASAVGLGIRRGIAPTSNRGIFVCFCSYK